MRLIDADKIHPDVRTQHGALAISQGQLAYAETVNAILIPEGATNGDVIKAMFDVKEVDMCNTYCVHFPEEEDYSHYFFKDWWNALYQKGGKK